MGTTLEPDERLAVEPRGVYLLGMFNTQTLFVVSSRRGAYFVEDLVAALRWSASGPFHIIAVDETGGSFELRSTTGCTVAKSMLPPATHPGFHRAGAVQIALQRGAKFQHVVLLDEQCLVLGRKLDEWCGPPLDKDKQLGPLGVQERTDREYLFRQSLPLLVEWRVPHERWEQPPISLSPYALFAPLRLILALQERNLLVPPECQRWLGHYGTYLSWVSQMLGFRAVSWGYVDKPLPPLLLHDGETANQMPPTVVSEHIGVYAPASKVLAYSEMDLREIGKRNRGEPARFVQPLSPAVSTVPG